MTRLAVDPLVNAWRTAPALVVAATHLLGDGYEARKTEPGVKVDMWFVIHIPTGRVYNFPVHRQRSGLFKLGSRKVHGPGSKTRQGRAEILGIADRLVKHLNEIQSRVPSSPWLFSSKWTDGDKVRLAVLFTHIFRDDFLAGVYGEFGRPNIQSLHELLSMPSAELEGYRKEIEVIATAYEARKDIKHALANYHSPPLPRRQKK